MATNDFDRENQRVQSLGQSMLRDVAVRINLPELMEEFIESQPYSMWLSLYREFDEVEEQYYLELLDLFLNME
jgi:hypothetical protein